MAIINLTDKNGNAVSPKTTADAVYVDDTTKLNDKITEINTNIDNLTAAASGGSIPSGLICMWSGSTIPTGWALCNGTNGTPDLRDRFIVGSGSTYSIGNTGGSASVTLTTAQMPSHTHTISITDPGHKHTVTDYAYMSNAGAIGAGMPRFNSDTSNVNTSSAKTGISASATNTGSGSSHENRPPYYALAFIMKL